MSIDREQAARKAAAMYSTDGAQAVFKYMELTSQFDPSTFSTDEWDRLQKEMLSLLPFYLHPSSGLDQERIRFMGDLSINLKFVGWSEPEFLTHLKKENVSDEIIEEIQKYVRESEVQRGQLSAYKSQRNALEKITQDAERIYRENLDKRSSERNKKVVQYLGLSSGKREEHINKEKVYVDYLDLVRKKGMSLQEATETVQEMHNILSVDATLKILFAYRKERLDYLEVNNPVIKPFFEKYTKGLIMPRGEWR